MKMDDENVSGLKKLLKHSLQVIEDLKSSSVVKNQDKIAVIGIGCRFPGGNDTPEKFLNFLLEGHICSTIYSELRQQKTNTKIDYPANFLTEDVTGFDPLFFNISPKEASELDPQQRILLEVVWETAERAGYYPQNLARNTGVFIGVIGSEFGKLATKAKYNGQYVTTGSLASMVSGRVSFALDYHGPSLSIDTACSASLVAVHEACEALINDECDYAFAGGVNLVLDADVFLQLNEIKALSRDGRCKPFSNNADGYGRAEGCGVVLLKRLKDAVKDHDNILAVISASAINHDGRSSGLTVPNGIAQQQLFQSALQKSGCKAESVSYVEMHGTGTPLGDPIEVEAINHVYGKNRSARNPLYLGSLKANIGHLEGAAGIASIIKSVMMLKHHKIPKQVMYDVPNRRLSFDDKILLADSTQAFDFSDRNIAVSSFGFSGANAHVVLSAHQAAKIQVSHVENHLFCLSAKNKKSLHAVLLKYLDYLSHTSDELADICYTANQSRSYFNERVSFVINSKSTLIDSIRNYIDDSDIGKNKLKNAKKCYVILLSPEAITIQCLSVVSEYLLGCKESQTDNLHEMFIKFIVNCLGQPLAIHNSGENPQDDYVLDLRGINEINVTQLLLTQFSKLYNSGFSINWNNFYSNKKFNKVILPTYAFMRESYWPNFTKDTSCAEAISLMPKNLSLPLSINLFDIADGITSFAEIKDTNNIVHVGVYIAVLANALSMLQVKMPFVLQHIEFKKALKVTEKNKTSMILSVENAELNKLWHFKSKNSDGDEWQTNVSGRLLYESAHQSFYSIADSCDQVFTQHQFYERMSAIGVHLGESVRRLDNIRFVNEIECVADIYVPAKVNMFNTLEFPPSLLDCCAQLFHAFTLRKNSHKKYMAIGIDELHVYSGSSSEQYICNIKIKESQSDNELFGDFFVFDANKILVMKALGCRMKAVAISFDKIAENNLLSVSSTEANHEIALAKAFCDILDIHYSHNFDVDEPLINYGLDSLTSATFKIIIDKLFNIDYPLDELTSGKSLADLVTEIKLKDKKIEKMQILTMHDAVYSLAIESWIKNINIKPTTKAIIYCLPYGGAGALIYKDWEKYFGQNLQVCPIQLPGREERLNEKPEDDASKLIGCLTNMIDKHATVPFFIYGHSFGALLSYGVSASLKNNSLLKGLFVGAFSSPILNKLNPWIEKLQYSLSLKNTNLAKLRQDLKQMNEDEINEFAKILLIPNHDSLNGVHKKIIMSILLNDLNVVSSFSTKKLPLITVPVSAFHGLSDDRVDLHEMEKWNELASVQFKLHPLEGDHFFINETNQLIKMLEIIQSEINLRRFACLDEHYLKEFQKQPQDL